jgi:hypothetical protein
MRLPDHRWLLYPAWLENEGVTAIWNTLLLGTFYSPLFTFQIILTTIQQVTNPTKDTNDNHTYTLKSTYTPQKSNNLNISNIYIYIYQNLQVSKVPPLIKHSSRILIQKLGDGSEILIIEGHIVRICRSGELRNSRHESRLLAWCSRHPSHRSGKRRSSKRRADGALEAISWSDVLDRWRGGS